MSKFDELVSLLEPLNTDDYGTWHIDTEHKGTTEDPKHFPFPVYTETVHKLIDAVYEFSEANPDYNLTKYSEILEERGLEWNMGSLETADISNMDAQGIMAMLMGLIRGERFCDGCILASLKAGTVQKWLKRLEEIDGEENCMSKIQLINGSCADQVADVVVNAANDGLWAGGGICGVIFKKAGMSELTAACKKYQTPLKDGSAVITPAFNMTNAKAIIHAVGPDFGRTPKAFKELFDAYYNSLKVMMDNGYHSISFPLISSGIFGGSLVNPVGESTKQCCRAYKKFVEDYPDYDIDVKVCVYSAHEVSNAQTEFDQYF